MKPQNVICPYCGRQAEFIDSTYVYARSYGMIYCCKPCKAWVGVHRGTTKPLGRLANKELRGRKIAAHNAFDKLWRGGGISRNQAYKWLAEQLGITPRECHIGMFDVEQCNRVVEICKSCTLPAPSATN